MFDTSRGAVGGQNLPSLVHCESSNTQGNNQGELRRNSLKTTDKTVQTEQQHLTRTKLDQPDQARLNTNLPLVLTATNSALVHQRASASDHLAAASMTTGASLPLMIGGRSKCVLNILDRTKTVEPAVGAENSALVREQLNSELLPKNHHQPPGPQNTALRAEQRRQNMSVSIVRPVVNHSEASSPAIDQYQPNVIKKSATTTAINNEKASLIDEWMSLEHKRLVISPLVSDSSILDQLLMNKFHQSNSSGPQDLSISQQYLKTEQELRQQAILLRREEHELNRNINRQHQFVLGKIDERKRYLQIIQSVWAQRDFKHAIEKLVDIYHQGLIFTFDDNDNHTTSDIARQQQQQQQQQHHHQQQQSRQKSAKINSTQLSSLNTSLVVDVVGIMILRPKLWTLEICQLLMPIIINDLLMQNKQEYYTEVALKSLKLILTHFSSVIKSTLESLKNSNKLVGVDLSREDRINKCLSCYKHLLEAQSIIASHRSTSSSNQTCCKLNAQYRELQALFSSLQASFDIDPLTLLRRSPND